MTHARSTGSLWPNSLAAREGVANAIAGRWTSVVLLLAIAWATGAVALANALDVSRLSSAERAWIAAGGYTIIVEPGDRDHSTLDAATCDRLAGVSGVKGAFAASVSQSAAAPISAASTRATVAHVSPGIYSFFAINPPPGAGVLGTPSTLEPLGLRAGDRTTLVTTSFDGTTRSRTQTVQIGLIDSPLIGDDLAGTWLVPDLLTGGAAQCYVSTDSAHVAAVSAYAAEALTAADGTPAVALPRLVDSGYGLDFASAYSQRPLGWASCAAAILLATLWTAVSWSRRGQLAIYATFGAGKRARTVIQFAHWTVLSVVATAWGWAVALCTALGLGADPAIALLQVSCHALVTFSVSGLGALAVSLLPVGTLLDALKDRP